MESQKKMTVDSSGHWKNQIIMNNFNTESSIYEKINDTPLDFNEMDINSGEITSSYDTKHKVLLTVEKGGPGFKSEREFKEAKVWGKSNRKGINNFGTGYKCDAMIPNEPCYSVFKIDTSLQGNICWTNTENNDDIPNEYEIPKDIMDVFREKFGSNTRITFAIYGERVNHIINDDLEDLEDLINKSYSLKYDDDDIDKIRKSLAWRYKSYSDKININGKPIEKLECSFGEDYAKSHDKGLDVKNYDKVNIEVFKDKKTKEVGFLKCTFDKKFHVDPEIKWIKLHGDKLLQSARPSNCGDQINDITMEIMEFKEDNKPDIEGNIHIEMLNPNGTRNHKIISVKGPIWAGWPGVHILLYGKKCDGFVDLLANKSRTNLNDKLENLLYRLIWGYYLNGYSLKDTYFSPAFHESKGERKPPCPPNIREDCIEDLIDWQEKKGLIKKGDKYYKCPCCNGLIEKHVPKGGEKCHRTAMGHILDLKSCKEKNGNDGNTYENLIPICELCNSAQGTKHMTTYIINRWGIESDNYKRYIQFCIDTGKKWEVD